MWKYIWSLLFQQRNSLTDITLLVLVSKYFTIWNAILIFAVWWVLISPLLTKLAPAGNHR